MPKGATATATLSVGDRAPDFTLRSHLGGEERLNSYQGHQNVVIAFYPLAFTPI